MNCLIVDDNKMARAALRHLVKDIGFLTLAGDCENAMEASDFIGRQKIDLLLLDVEMPHMSGFDFLKTLPTHPLVILITAQPDYAVAAFEYNVVDFIVKPVKEDRFRKAVQRAKEAYESHARELALEKDYFFVREKGVSTKLIFSEILYIQALGDYVTIYTPAKRYTIHYTLSAIEKELPASRFMRVHRSYILALDRVDSVEEGTAYVYQNPVPVADNQRAELMRRLNSL